MKYLITSLLVYILVFTSVGCSRQIDFSSLKLANKQISIYLDDSLDVITSDGIKFEGKAWARDTIKKINNTINADGKRETIVISETKIANFIKVISSEEYNKLFNNTREENGRARFDITCDIFMNAEITSGQVYLVIETIKAGEDYAKSIIVHELGHLLGFKDHSEIRGDAMYAEYGAGYGYIFFSDSEITKLRGKYGLI